VSQKVAEIVTNLRASAGLGDSAVPVIGVLPFDVLKAKQLIHGKSKASVFKGGENGSLRTAKQLTSNLRESLSDWNNIFEKHVPDVVRHVFGSSSTPEHTFAHVRGLVAKQRVIAVGSLVRLGLRGSLLWQVLRDEVARVLRGTLSRCS